MIDATPLPTLLFIHVPCQLAIVDVLQELSARHLAELVQPATLVHIALSPALTCDTVQHALQQNEYQQLSFSIKYCENPSAL